MRLRNSMMNLLMTIKCKEAAELIVFLDEYICSKTFIEPQRLYAIDVL